MTNKLRTRNYPERTIAKTRKRARNNNSEALLKPTTRNQEEQKLICVTTYNIASDWVKKVINSAF